MKSLIKGVAIALCNVAILITTGVFAIYVGDVAAPKAQTAPPEVPMGCARFTDEEIDFLREIIEREVGTLDKKYENDVSPAIEEKKEVITQDYNVAPETQENVADGNVVLLQSENEQLVMAAYTEEELNILALIIYQEAGGNIFSDETRLMVGNVFLNRVKSNEFPNTFYEVATAYRQYGSLYWTGIVWPVESTYECEKAAVERAFDCARRLLDGERIFEDDVVWQAEFPQGTETVKIQDGIYFCK